jgi:undecaprenyl-diphosphatase
MSETLTTIWKATVLGIVEGLTEFLPVSSTGHLILVSHYLEFGSAEFEIIIQLGAMLALTWVYRERLLGIAKDLPERPETRAFVGKVALAFMPAAVIGLLFHDWIEAWLFRPGFVSSMLVVGGLLILWIDAPGRRASTADLEEVSWNQALAIGFGQCLALMPGVSRSGSTIITGLVAGLERRVATDFSFLLALPTMYGACLYTIFKARDRLTDELGLGMVVGLVAAYVSSLVVIHVFLRFVQTNSLRPFGWYRIVVGGVLVIVFWSGWGN